MENIIKIFVYSFLGMFIITFGMIFLTADKNYRAVGDTINSDLLSFTLDRAELSSILDKDGLPVKNEDSSRYFAVADDGFVFVSYEYSVTNISKNDINISRFEPNMLIDKEEFISPYNCDHNGCMGNSIDKINYVSYKRDSSWVKYDIKDKNTRILKPKERISVRAYFKIKLDSFSDLDQVFKLNFYLPRRDGIMNYIYKINSIKESN